MCSAAAEWICSRSTVGDNGNAPACRKYSIHYSCHHSATTTTATTTTATTTTATTTTAATTTVLYKISLLMTAAASVLWSTTWNIRMLWCHTHTCTHTRFLFNQPNFYSSRTTFLTYSEEYMTSMYILRTDDWPRILENFERPYVGNGSFDPLHVLF